MLDALLAGDTWGRAIRMSGGQALTKLLLARPADEMGGKTRNLQSSTSL